MRYNETNELDTSECGEHEGRTLVCEVIAIADIEADWTRNARTKPMAPDLEDLRASLVARGMLEPIGVARRDGATESPLFDLVWGWRRLEAARILGWSTVPARIVEGTKTARAIDTLLENLGRRDLTTYEEAKGIDALVKLIRADTGKKPTMTSLAKLLGKDISVVSRLQKAFTKCPPELLEKWQNGGSIAPVIAATTETDREAGETRGRKANGGPKVDKKTAMGWARGIDVIKKTMRRRSTEMSSDYRDGVKWALGVIMDGGKEDEEITES